MEFRTYFVYFHTFSYKFKVQRTPTAFGLPVIKVIVDRPIKGGATGRAGGAIPTNFQLWDNLKLYRLRYTLVWQAKILRPDVHTLHEAISCIKIC